MGNIFAYFSSPRRLYLIGLDGAGKSTLTRTLKDCKAPGDTCPTVGFEVEKVNVGNRKLSVWDIGGQDAIRRLWRNYLIDADILIYMIDIHDHARTGLAVDELYKFLIMDREEKEQKLKDTPIVIIANKIDRYVLLNDLTGNDYRRVVDDLLVRLQTMLNVVYPDPETKPEIRFIPMSLKIDVGVDEFRKTLEYLLYRYYTPLVRFFGLECPREALLL